MMKSFGWALALFVGVGSAQAQQDGIDLSQAAYHGSPDISRWPVTVALEAVELKSGRASDGNTVGVRPVFDRATVNRRWPDVKPPGWEGFIQYTFWACVQPADRWHCAGLHEFWSDRNGSPRIWTGAPLLTQWSDWVYRGQWGPEMEAYRPREGDEIVFLLTAGDRRLMDLGDVRERSNAIRVHLVADGLARPLVGGVTPSPVPDPQPQPSPAPLPSPSPDLVSQIASRLAALEAYASQLFESVTALSAAVEQHRSVVETLSARVQVLEARPVWARCSAAVAMFQIHIPVRCQLQGP